MKKIAKILLIIFCFNVIGVLNSFNVKVYAEEVDNEITKDENNNEITKEKQIKEYDIEEYDRELGDKLNYTDKEIINEIASAMRNKQPYVNLESYSSYIGTDYKKMGNLYFRTLDEYPDIFYPNPNSVTRIGYTLKISYLFTSSEIDTLIPKFNNIRSSIRRNVTNYNYGQLQNEYIVHDYLCENCKYDENYKNGTADRIVHTAYGALVNGDAVCDGYSKAAKLLLNDVGIECGLLQNTEKNHAWNYVKIGQNYYQLDITWDDTLGNEKIMSYRYFNITDKKMREDHNYSLTDYPECKDDTFSFLTERDQYAINHFRDRDKIYFIDSNGNLCSVDLNGQNRKVVKEEYYHYIVAVNKNQVYNASITDVGDGSGKIVTTIYTYNIIDQSSEIVFQQEGYMNNIYKKNKDLIIEMLDGRTYSISIARNEDVNDDGLIDMKDVARVASLYNKQKGQPSYNAKFDLNNDAVIDIYDISMVAGKIA